MLAKQLQFIVLFLYTGSDYRCNACNRTLIAGMSSVLFNIAISDDGILELDEDFMLSNISTFIPSSSSIRVIMGSPESTTIVIEDNDCELFELYEYIIYYVTGFAKRGLIHASNFATLRMCNSAHV